MGIRRLVRNLRMLSRSAPDTTTGGWESLLGIANLLKDGRWPSLSVAEQEQAYKNSSIVYACVNEIVTTVPEAPLVLIRTRDDAVVESHPVLDLLTTPNAYYSTDMLLRYLTTRLLLAGEGYLWKWRRGGQFPSELWPVPTSWVTVKTGSGGNIIGGYGLREGGGKREAAVAAEDMLRAWLPDPESTYKGLSPIAAATRDYTLEQERENYLRDMLKNTVIAGLVFKSDRALTPPQKDDIRAWLKDAVGGERRGEPLVVSGPGSGVENVTPLADLDWPGFSEMTETRICAVYGVPPILVAIRAGLKFATYSNYELARRSFYTETMSPFWSLLAAALTFGLLAAEGDSDHEFRYDTTQVPAMQEDLGKRVDRATRLVSGAIWTRNQALEAIGDEPVDGGDVYLMPIGITEVPAPWSADYAAYQQEQADAADRAAALVDALKQSQAADTDDAGADGGADDDADTQDAEPGSAKAAPCVFRNRADRAHMLALSRARFADAWLVKYRSTVKRAFRPAYDDIIKAAESGQNGLTDGWEKAFADALADEQLPVALAMAVHGYELSLVELGALSLPDAMMPLHRSAPLDAKAFDDFLKVGLGSADNPIDPELIARKVRADVEGWIHRTAKHTAETQRARLGRLIANARNANLTAAQIAKRIISAKITAVETQAELIARTATIWNYNEGAQLSYKDSGVTAKEWSVTLDDVTCEYCQAMSGVQTGIDEPFLAGGKALDVKGSGVEREDGSRSGTLEAPWDIDHPPLHPHCRCALLPVIVE